MAVVIGFCCLNLTAEMREHENPIFISGSGGAIELDNDPYAITNIAFSPDTKVLVISGQTDQVNSKSLVFLNN